MKKAGAERADGCPRRHNPTISRTRIALTHLWSLKTQTLERRAYERFWPGIGLLPSNAGRFSTGRQSINRTWAVESHCQNRDQRRDSAAEGDDDLSLLRAGRRRYQDARARDG